MQEICAAVVVIDDRLTWLIIQTSANREAYGVQRWLSLRSGGLTAEKNDRRVESFDAEIPHPLRQIRRRKNSGRLFIALILRAASMSRGNLPFRFTSQTTNTSANECGDCPEWGFYDIDHLHLNGC